jgi:SAM-dependent methyltransferase
VGAADINGSYASIFEGPATRFQTADLSGVDGVDIALLDPYRIPVDDASYDIVVSGQMLEHCDFFWLTFQEMVRVLRPDGFLFLIAPSAGPVHRYPVDCYRFHPDAFAALARYAGCHLVECWVDERGPWHDVVGVFTPRPVVAASARVASGRLATLDHVPGSSRDTPFLSPETERMAGQQPYLDVLARIHEELEPATYLEIGVRHGRSLALARTGAIGVDPEPEIEVALPPATRVFTCTSDTFFETRADGVEPPIDLAFVDGMHLFEFVLRDLMHVERLAGPGSLVVIDDVLPNHPLQAARERRTQVWTGDVWKIQACLRAYRPDLTLLLLDTSPTGLLLIAHLDPRDRALWEAYNPIVREYTSSALEPPAAVLRRDGVVDPDDAQVGRLLRSLRDARRTAARAPTPLTRPA